MTKPVLLTVDDDVHVLSAVARDLRKRYGRDYRILRAESGAAALELLAELKHRGEPVALMLSDQRMPKMDGVAFLSEAMKYHPESKRALLTAYADTEAAIGAINQSQVDYYLLKPWDPPDEKLYPVLDDMLDDWRATFRPGYGGVRVIGERWSAECHRVRDFLARNQVPYHFLDVESSPEARTLASGNNDDAPHLPLVMLPDGTELAAPELVEIAEHIGLKTKARERFYDLAIVGAGPAGLAAAVYGGSEGLRTVLIERQAPGGQAGTSSKIENYLGFPARDLGRRACPPRGRPDAEIRCRDPDAPRDHLAQGRRTLQALDSRRWIRDFVPRSHAVDGRVMEPAACRRGGPFGRSRNLLRCGDDGGAPRQGADCLHRGWR